MIKQDLTGEEGFVFPDYFDAELWQCVPQPFIHEVSANEIMPGQSLIIDGYGFGSHKRWVSVWFDNCQAEITEFSAERLVVEAPRSISDVTELIISVNDLLSQSIRLMVKPFIEHIQDERAESYLNILGTSHPCLVDVEMTSTLLPGFSGTLQSTVINGKNLVPLGLGGVSPDFVNYKYSLVEVMAPFLAIPYAMPLPDILFSVYIQTVTRKEKDPVTGKDRTVWYFFRDGKWWRIRDPEKKSADDPELVDLEDDKPEKNFVEADQATTAALNTKFFPTDWEKHWEGFEEVSKRQLQIMFIMLTQMNGVDAEDADLVLQIRRMLGEGKTIDQILSEKESKIYKAMIGVAIGAVTVGGAAVVKKTGLGGYLRRFLGKFFSESRIFRKITRRRETPDSLELDIDPTSTLGRQGKVKGNLKGKVNRDQGRLDVDSGTENFENNGAGRGFVRRLGADWLEQMKEFARRKGLSKVRVTQWACTKEGAEAARKMGMRPVPGRTKPDGTGQWEQIFDVSGSK